MKFHLLSKREEVKDADISKESDIDGNEDIKDQIIVELKLQIDYQQKQIEDDNIFKKKALTRDNTGEDINIEKESDIYMPSDEEEIFPEESFQIDRTIVSNFFNSKNNIIDYIKVPADLFEEDFMFKATPTALNNRHVFIACNNLVGYFKPDTEGREKFCQLAPVCNLSWKAQLRFLKYASWIVTFILK
jgi:hypothetical protein